MLGSEINTLNRGAATYLACNEGTTAFGYTAGGSMKTLTLRNAVTGDQTTRWVYGTTLEDSGVARGDLLRAKIYPESDDEHDPLGNGPQGEFDRTEYTYNRQGGKITMKDPNGTVHEYVYNPMGKRIHDRVATFGSGAIDDAVKRITTAYDTRGFVATLTSYDDATVGSGTVLNEVAYEYNDFGHLAKDKQEHSGAVDGNTPEVAYAYEDGSSGNTARRVSTTYPDGRVLEYGYGSIDSADDLLGRLATIKIQGETDNAVEYAYLGLGTVVETSSPEPGLVLSYFDAAAPPFGDAGDPYTGYDRFGRVVDMPWRTGGGSTTVDRFQYGYDRSSQRTWKANLAATPGDGQDEAYRYDGLYQVTQAARGDLNINRTAVSGVPASDETFAYDPTGNWDRYTERTDGAVTLDQPRVNNKDNQITQFDGSSENVSYDRNGNATEMAPGYGGDWTKHNDLRWDAWNRLVEISQNLGHVIHTAGRYTYDGAFRRQTVTVDNGSVDETRHEYWNDQWKPVEERVDASTDPSRQHVWSPLNRNVLVLRDRDTDGNGTLDERFYATRDAMASVTAIVDTSAAVQERYGYSAFGVRRVVDSSFGAETSTGYDWRSSFHGEMLDLETGYENYGFRYYVPRLGRWLSRDPIGERGGVNLYSFVGNDGVKNIDMYGLQAPEPLPDDSSDTFIFWECYVEGSTRMDWNYNCPCAIESISGSGESGVSRSDAIAAAIADAEMSLPNNCKFGSITRWRCNYFIRQFPSNLA